MTTASFEATQIGYRVTIKSRGKVVASSHFAARLTETGYGAFATIEAIGEAYEEAKKFAAAYGCK